MTEALTELVAELLPGYGPVRSVSRFAEGSVTGAYRVEFHGWAPVVLKDHGNRSWAAKEARALRFLTDHGIGISPRVLAVGATAVVSTLRPGRTVESLDGELSAAQRQDIYRQVGVVLRRLHAVPAPGYGDMDGEIVDPLPDNSAHLARMVERLLREFRDRAGDPALADRLGRYFARHAPAFADCRRPAYCHGDVHEPNLLVALAEDGTCRLTGLLDPGNMHAGDPLMDLARLDAFSMAGDPVKMAGLLSGYGVPAGGRGGWPEAWRPRLRLYRVLLAVELFNWFTMSGQRALLPAIERELRDYVD